MSEPRLTFPSSLLREGRSMGIPIVLSAPSGAGKTTIRQGAVKALSDVVAATSCTTRPARPGELEGMATRGATGHDATAVE